MTGPLRPPVLVCFAVREEAAPFRRVLPGHVTVVVSGMGPAAAETAARQHLAAHDWSAVFTCGFAGGLNPALARGTVLCDADDAFPFRARLLAAGALPARFHCADRVATTASGKTALRERTGADAVEMESGIIRRLCREHDVPCATVRVISDAAGDDLPLDFNALMTADQRLHPGRLAWAILRSPSVIGGLLQLRRRCVLAARRLDGVLVDALSRLSVGGSQATCRGD